MCAFGIGTIHWRVACSDRFRPLRASHLIRCAHPSGQPAAVTSLRFVALACPRESNQREGHPAIRPRLRRGSLVPSLLEGSLRRAIPGPSQLSRHPCRSTPYAAIPLGLLKGTCASSVRSRFKSKSQTLSARGNSDKSVSDTHTNLPVLWQAE